MNFTLTDKHGTKTLFELICPWESFYLQYLDANNLYGWAMSQPLPTGEFNWVSIDPSEVGELVRRDKGYLLEADVSYRKELHDLHNDLPFMCERMKINGVEKLTPNE